MPTADRVLVLIDGQNLYQALRRAHGTRVHPLLLARELADGRELVGCRYYSGIHERDEDPDLFDFVTRRHDLMRRTGVTVVERTLRYHWEWEIIDDLPRPDRAGDDEIHRVRARRARVAREKGIDLALGLDAVYAAFTDAADTLVIVSRDRDLVEIAAEIDERARTRHVSVEVALVEDHGVHGLEGYDRTHWIDSDMVQRCRDRYDYRNRLDPDDVQGFVESLTLV